MIADPVLTGTNANQILTWDLTGTAVAASATANLTYRVAVSSTTTGNKTNTATVDATMSGDQLLGLRHRDSQRRHPAGAALGDEPGRAPRGRPDAADLNNTTRGEDLAFNDSYADSSSDNWADEGSATNDSFVWDAVQNSSKATITKAIAMVRFSVNTAYTNDRFEWQVCVQATCSPDGGRRDAQQLEEGPLVRQRPGRDAARGRPGRLPADDRGRHRPDRPEHPPTGTHADRVQFRIIGMGSSGGGDTFVIYLDEVLVVTE